MKSTTRTAVITGASRGLGRALSLALARRGWGVVGVARPSRDLDSLEVALQRITPRSWVFGADIADHDASARIAGFAASVGGEIDLLVNNASTLGPVPLRPLLDLEPARLREVLETNLVGPFSLSRAVGRGMALRGRGSIAFVSSDAARASYPGWGPYGLSKAAADHLAGTLGAELAEYGVTVWSFDPGEMDTRMHANAIPEADPASLADPAVVAESFADLLAEGQNGRLTYEEVA